MDEKSAKEEGATFEKRDWKASRRVDNDIDEQQQKNDILNPTATTEITNP
jgi:hypothetical protein